LNRTTRSVSLTQEGEHLLARLTPILAELSATLGDVTAASGHPNGVIKINGSEGAIRLLKLLSLDSACFTPMLSWI
jgi:DNA-binding transcriptional LysR family regulator